MKLEWIEGVPTTDGKYALRRNDGAETIRLMRNGTWLHADGKAVWLAGPDDMDCVAHAFLEPLEPAAPPKAAFKEWNEWPTMFRWIDNGKEHLAVELFKHCTSETRVYTSDGQGSWCTTRLGIPADAERLDPNDVQNLKNTIGTLGIEIERLRSLEAHHAMDLAAAQARVAKLNSTNYALAFKSAAAERDTLQSENRTLRERVEKMRQDVMRAVGITKGGTDGNP